MVLMIWREYSFWGIYFSTLKLPLCSKFRDALYNHLIVRTVNSHGKQRKIENGKKLLNPNFVQNWGMRP